MPVLPGGYIKRTSGWRAKKFFIKPLNPDALMFNGADMGSRFQLLSPLNRNED
jgi:hypothetical protein